MTGVAPHELQHSAGRVEDFEVGRFRIVELENRSIGIVNAGDEFYAVLNVCPHALAPVCEGRFGGTALPCPPGEEPAFGLENRILRCPWHHYEFDLGGGGQSVFTDFRARVRLFPVTVSDGEVFVTIRVRSNGEKQQRGRRRARAAATTDAVQQDGTAAEQRQPG